MPKPRPDNAPPEITPEVRAAAELFRAGWNVNEVCMALRRSRSYVYALKQTVERFLGTAA